MTLSFVLVYNIEILRFNLDQVIFLLVEYHGRDIQLSILFDIILSDLLLLRKSKLNLCKLFLFFIFHLFWGDWKLGKIFWDVQRIIQNWRLVIIHEIIVANNDTFFTGHERFVVAWFNPGLSKWRSSFESKIILKWGRSRILFFL